MSWVRGAIALLVVLIIAVFIAMLSHKVNPTFDVKMPEIGLPLGVMIENELAARPFQQGLSKADIIYEAPTEGNITRFLALFAPGKYPEKMGPVRSARTYFLDWMHEYKGVYVHVGGNPDALARLRKEKIFDADQFTYDKYFRRENVGRTALEHTMFTSGEKMRALIEEKKWIREERTQTTNNKQQTTVENFGNYPTANEISIDFGSPTYRVQYTYNQQRKEYLRSQAGKPHMDEANSRQLFAKTVIIQHVKSWSNRDAEGSISIKTIDKGKATIFYEGHMIEGTWAKKALNTPTEFFDDEEKKFSLRQGPVWIEVLTQYNSLTYAPIEEATPPLVTKTPTKKNPILMYHYIGEIPADQKNNPVRKDLTVSTENFEAQLQWLKKNGYTTPESIMLTFDDGYDDAYSTVFPLLEKYDFRGIFAIITGKVDTPGYLNWTQILAMKRAGMEFWSHTVSHADLRTLPDKMLEAELTHSKTTLEEKLGMKIDGFVYPAGKYDERTMKAVKKAGYLWARTTKNGLVMENTPPFELPTVRIHGNTNIIQFSKLLMAGS